MPYAPVLGREEARRQAPTGPTGAADRHQLIGAIAACQQQLTDLLGRLDASTGTSERDGAPIAEPPEAGAPAKQAVETTLRRLDEVAARERGTAQLTEFEERVWRRLVDVMQADVRRIEAGVHDEVERLRREVETVRREPTAVGAEPHDAVARANVQRLSGEVATVRGELATAVTNLHEAMARESTARVAELAALGDIVQRSDTEYARRQRTATDQVGTQLAAFETRVWQRLVETIRADGRRIEAGLHAEIEALRSEVATVRREQAAVGTELRGAIVQRDTVRATEVAALGGAIERLDAHVAQTMATVDERIVHHVRRARIAVEEEMAVLRHWIEVTTAGARGGVWSTLTGALGDPLGALTAIVRRLPGF